MSAMAKTDSQSDEPGVTYIGDTVVSAGSLVHFEIRIESPAALPPGTEIGLARRWPSDWGTPQFDEPAARDHVDIVADGTRALRWWTARMHAWHPFDHVLFVSLADGLPAGTPLRAMFGGRRGESPGFTAQTFIEEASPLSVRMRRAADDEWLELARPAVRVAGNVAHRLVLTAPSRVESSKPFALHLRIEDKWGNPSRLDEPVRVDGLDQPLRIPACGWMRFDATLRDAGIHRIAAHAGDGFTATSNPIEVANGRGPLDRMLCWGDLHAQSVIGCGARTIDAYYSHARDFAATDFGSHQANCFLVSNAEWAETAASTARTHDDGRFVTLLGVEWSAASAYGGDHNLYFPGDAADLQRCSHEFVADKSDAHTDIADIEALHRHYRGTDTLVAVHVGGRTADLRWHDRDLDRLLEVHSTHATSEWFLLDALRRGYRMGVIAGSDSVDGRPGASHPGHMGVRNVRGGLTAVSMPSLTRASLWSALKARHCYGTTGARILLDLGAGGARMGDEIRTRDVVPPFDVTVEGTAALETIDFFRDDTLIESIDLLAMCGDPGNAIRIGWRGTTAPGNWQRARMLWTGSLRVDGAKIVDVRPWALDTPDEGLIDSSDAQVRFRTITAGDWDGVIVTLDPAGDARIEDAELMFVTEPMKFRVRLSDLGTIARTFDAGNPARTVELRRLPREMPAPGWRGTFVDRSPIGGDHAYWVRVRQCDGEQAWSTPIFVTRETA